MPPPNCGTATCTAGPAAPELGIFRKLRGVVVAMLRAVPSNVWPAATSSSTSFWRSRIGSLTTSCIATPWMSAGSAGSGGVVSNGVRVLSTKGGLTGPGGMGPIGTPRSYWGNGGAGTVGAVSFSDDPAALKTTPGAVGGTPKGVLLNDGKDFALEQFRDPVQILAPDGHDDFIDARGRGKLAHGMQQDGGAVEQHELLPAGSRLLGGGPPHAGAQPGGWQNHGYFHRGNLGSGSVCLWGSQSWLQAGFPAGLDALESGPRGHPAGRIACPTNKLTHGQTDPLPQSTILPWFSRVRAAPPCAESGRACRRRPRPRPRRACARRIFRKSSCPP